MSVLAFPWEGKQMSLTSVVCGSLALAYGFYGLAIYRLGKEEQKFENLAPMRKMFGQKAGTVIHFCFYVILPIIAGAGFIGFGLRGINILTDV